LDDNYFLTNEHAEARDLLPVVSDVPTATTVDFTSDIVPLAAPLTTGIDFDVIRDFPDGVVWYRPGTATSSFIYLSDYCGYRDDRSGIYFHSEPVEFLELSGSPIAACTTPADTDGDGRTDVVTVPADISGPGFTQVVPGDYIEISGTGIGTRAFEIKSMAYSVNTDVTVYLDEIPPGLSGLSCRLLRRKFWKARTLKSTTVTEETIV
jgi:hypothetical protein